MRQAAKIWRSAFPTSASCRCMWTRRFWQQAVSLVCRFHSRTRTRVKPSVIAGNLQARYFDHRIPTCRTSTPQKQHIRDTSMIYFTNRFEVNPIEHFAPKRNQIPTPTRRKKHFSLHHFPYPLTTHCGIATHPTQPTPHMRTNLIQIVHQQKTHNLSKTMSHNANEPQSLVIFHPEPTTQNESKHPNHPKTIQCATAFRRIFDAAVPTETPCEATFPVSVCACTRRVWG